MNQIVKNENVRLALHVQPVRPFQIHLADAEPPKSQQQVTVCSAGQMRLRFDSLWDFFPFGSCHRNCHYPTWKYV